MMKRNRDLRWRCKLRSWGLMGLFAFLLAIAVSSPLAAQIPFPIPTTAPSVGTPQLNRQQITYNRSNNIIYAPVKLDGQTLFKLAVETSFGEQLEENKDSLIQRLGSVEAVLREIVERNESPESLNVVVAVDEELPVLRISREEEQPLHLATVTQVDRKVPGQELPLFDLATQWRDILQTSIEKAIQERQPDAIAQKVKIALGIIVGAIALSIVLIWLQKRATVKREDLKEQSQRLNRDAQQTQTRPLSPTGELNFSFPLQFFTDNLLKLDLERRQNINRLIRQSLRWSQVAIIYASITGILFLFPQTRQIGWGLLGTPLQILGIWLFITLANKISDILIDRFLKEWVEFQPLNLRSSKSSQRKALRAPSFAKSFKGLLTFIFFVIGVFWSLSILNVPIGSVLTVSALVGFAITWGSQNLIKDTINGCLILLEDQYAVGDVIAIGEVSGLVENMNLRITQLRNIEGELITIPNHAIEVVRNMSNGWSQVKFDFDINYDADLDKATMIMQEVAQEMYQDSEWEERIVEPPQLLGIDRLDHTGIRISILIKTQPLKQWDVAREYRRRLKFAFDIAEISIGTPQQSLIVKNASQPAAQDFEEDILHMENAEESHPEVD
ncbi:mechanosensitive ion channel family protein [Lusitaniella coriacea LEGE 07157]|uniref:Mechanosensitive ion channel family protein n=1 Tax=Lusitaniella coriacea LEGE 07157 TaxID=945747 RepID=A0A8J7J669_9CYAN|nr:mechanosensitive ion channel family protein [Lusitaniella coriacea]MBE9118504.1 mechanosensitive ion channel family protein [Lusitaniella coriacea LEGE 07157]